MRNLNPNCQPVSSIDISTFLLPLALLSVIYSRLAVKIRRLETPGNRVARHEHIIQEKRMKVSGNSRVLSANRSPPARLSRSD